jgi:hypothetical protein
MLFPYVIVASSFSKRVVISSFSALLLTWALYDKIFHFAGGVLHKINTVVLKRPSGTI